MSILNMFAKSTRIARFDIPKYDDVNSLGG